MWKILNALYDCRDVSIEDVVSMIYSRQKELEQGPDDE